MDRASASQLLVALSESGQVRPDNLVRASGILLRAERPRSSDAFECMLAMARKGTLLLASLNESEAIVKNFDEAFAAESKKDLPRQDDVGAHRRRGAAS